MPACLSARHGVEIVVMKRVLTTVLFAILAVLQPQPQELWCPTPTNRLVNDYAGELSTDEVARLEQRLVAFDDSTSNQILVVITPTLHGCEIMELGTRIGTTWGVGQKELKNGVLILIKSKTDEEPNGDVALLPGYGLEGALPDAFCMHIIDDCMIEPLADGDYYKALTQALDVIEPVCRGEYSYDDYKRHENDAIWVLLAFIVGSVVITIVLSKIANKHGGGGGGGDSGTPFLGGGMSGGYWGGGFGGSSGGFGGFGGGSFGGGGAHGRF